MIMQDLNGYNFSRMQITGTFLAGPHAGRTVYFGDVEMNRSYTAGDEFKRFTPESANKALAFQANDGGEIGGSMTFYQWNEASKDIEAMGHASAKDQIAAMGLLVTAPAIKNDRVLLEKYNVSNVVVSDGDEVIYDEGVDYHLHNDGKSPAVITLKNIPDGAGETVHIDFDCAQKKISARGLLQYSQFEMRIVGQERVKANNPTPPATVVLERCMVVLDGDISDANTAAELKTVTAKFTVLANTSLEEPWQYGYVARPE